MGLTRRQFLETSVSASAGIATGRFLKAETNVALPAAVAASVDEEMFSVPIEGQPVDISPWAYLWRADREVQEMPEAYFIPRRLEREDKHSFAILDNDRIAGIAALSNVVRGPLQSANLGYWVGERVNGRGLATDSVRELIPIAFGDLGLHRLEAGTLVDNRASQRVLEKNGFERIGIARGYLHIGGAWRDHVLFQLLAG